MSTHARSLSRIRPHGTPSLHALLAAKDARMEACPAPPLRGPEWAVAMEAMREDEQRREAAAPAHSGLSWDDHARALAGLPLADADALAGRRALDAQRLARLGERGHGGGAGRAG